MNKLSTKSLILCSLFAALIAVGAFIKIPIPVVPFTLQVLFTTLAGLLLGPRLGAISVGIYLLIGLIGIPVFTQGGGPSYIFQPTFGYLIGFLIGAYLTGYIAHKDKNPSLKRLVTASLIGLSIVYIFGMVYYYFIANYYLNSPITVGGVIFYCFLVCVPGDFVLCLISAVIAKRTIPVIKGQVLTNEFNR
ncbi:biotin transporter BioY [Clostridioides difficile]